MGLIESCAELADVLTDRLVLQHEFKLAVKQARREILLTSMFFILLQKRQQTNQNATEITILMTGVC
ncbi:hypothetical protein C7B67_16470 [filamentous cyanobacterium Phorm 6]|nr:hypothetical protein C7B67_16470 [filamentous cyanobacterium Phorm 6]